MKRLLFVTISLIFVTVAAAQQPAAEDLEDIGLRHFKKGFYEATPRRDMAAARAEYAGAENAFREAIRLRPDRIEPYLLLGRTYFVQKKYVRSAETYQRALRRAPERRDIYLKLASAWEMAGRYPEAIAALEAMKADETDERAIGMLDGFIQQLRQRASGEPGPGSGGE